jgi:hypothetical protein
LENSGKIKYLQKSNFPQQNCIVSIGKYVHPIMDELEKVLEEPSFENLVALVENKKNSQDQSALDQLEGIFVKILLVHIENIPETAEIFTCLETALQYYPENCEILNELANFLVR